ncbi:MAG: pyridoxamine 5'-phosphate oxidase family protein [Clostridia bacterium]|nr:pyridoxamine 5'-phosphate oxidase family protein [Clostridia bacterium]MDD4387313.1 pyridoxamine 5'-phosphate oxidase family protein [Clostridia bacterium]
MEETFEFLKNTTKVNFVATINGDAPSNRPFGDPVLFENKIYVLTNKKKQVSKQIKLNNKVCIVAYDAENENWIRINCELIDDSNNISAKQAIIDEFDWAEEAGYTLDNPNFQALYIANADVKIYNIDGNVLNSYTF